MNIRKFILLNNINYLNLFKYNIKPNISNVRLCQTKSFDTKYNELLYESKFTVEEQEKILKTLNESSLEELYKFDASKGRLKNIQTWRTRKGPFILLSDVLEVEGLGIKILEKLCNSIIHSNVSNDGNLQDNSKSTKIVSKVRRQILTPILDASHAKAITSAIGLHLTPTGISWSKILRGNNSLENWNYHDFSDLPKKLLPNDIFQLAIKILGLIPHSDVYVIESSVQLGPQAQSTQKQNSPNYTQQLELTAMLMALINTSSRHNAELSDVDQPKIDSIFEYNTNKVYYLRANLPARLFSTLVGNERVSSAGIIDNLLQLKPDKQEDLPCTSLTCNKQLQEYYTDQRPIHKHLLGQALLLVMTFMDICIYRNQLSLKAIAPGNRRKN